MSDAAHERITVPQWSDDENATLNLLNQILADKHRRNVLRACYYDGKRAITQIGTVIPPQYYRLGIVLGWSAKAVDILARRCNLDAFVWPDGDIGSLGSADVWTANGLHTEINSGITSSLIHATSFLVTTRGGPSEPAALIHVKDAMNATGQWDSRLRRLRNLLSVTDRDDDGKPTELTLYLFGLTLSAAKDKGRWKETDRSEHPWGVPADPLVYKARTGRDFGSSRISRPVMSMHDMALRTVIRMEGHADIYSFPEMWMLGADESIFKNVDGSMKASWQVMLGRIKGIPDDADAEPNLARADVKQFSASSPQPHIDQLKQQAQLFSGETSIPLTSLGVSDMSNPTSADSYIASREDLIAEAEGATDDWGPALQRTFTRALAIANGLTSIPPEWSSIAPKWRSPIYLSRAAQADAGTKQLTAVPWLADTEVGLELLGLDEQQITRAQADRRRIQGRSLLTRLAGTANAVGG